MARYVIDAPTLVQLVDQQMPVAADHQLVAPNSIRAEALQILLDQVNRGERTEQDALEIHERMTELKMRLLGDRVSRRTAWKIAREHGWKSLRDAEHVAIARLQADALVTVDPGLAQSASDIVQVLPLNTLCIGDPDSANAGPR